MVAALETQETLEGPVLEELLDAIAPANGRRGYDDGEAHTRDLR